MWFRVTVGTQPAGGDSSDAIEAVSVKRLWGLFFS